MISTDLQGLPRWHGVKELPASVEDARDLGLIPGSGRSHRVGNGNSLQYSCLENPMDRGAKVDYGPRDHRVIMTEVTEHSTHVICYCHNVLQNLYFTSS